MKPESITFLKTQGKRKAPVTPDKVESITVMDDPHLMGTLRSRYALTLVKGWLVVQGYDS
jgi:hypothetical protein